MIAMSDVEVSGIGSARIMISEKTGGYVCLYANKHDVFMWCTFGRDPNAPQCCNKECQLDKSHWLSSTDFFVSTQSSLQ